MGHLLQRYSLPPLHHPLSLRTAAEAEAAGGEERSGDGIILASGAIPSRRVSNPFFLGGKNDPPPLLPSPKSMQGREERCFSLGERVI